MKCWAILTANGGLLERGVFCDETPSVDACGFDMTDKVAVEIATPLGDFELVDLDGNVTADLPALRARAWVEVKALRDQAEWAGCDTPLGRVDTDPNSRSKISGAVQMAMLIDPFTIDWTMQDNSIVTHDAPAMIAMGLLVGQHVNACHAIATTIRTALDAADTLEAIAAAGVWP